MSAATTSSAYVKKLVTYYGIKTDTDDTRVYSAIDQFVHRVVKNVIQNLRVVLEVSKQKLVTPKHFQVLLELSNMSLAFPRKEINRAQKGGDPVLPSEYFGGNSGRYAAEVPPFQTSVAVLTEGIARSGLTDTFGSVLVGGSGGSGGGSSIPKKVVNGILKELNSDIRLSKEAKALLYETLRQNVEHFLTDLKKASTFQKAGLTTLATVKKVLGYHKYKFL